MNITVHQNGLVDLHLHSNEWNVLTRSLDKTLNQFGEQFATRVGFSREKAETLLNSFTKDLVGSQRDCISVKGATSI